MKPEHKELYEELEHAKTDSDRLKALLDFALVFSDESFVEGWKFSNEALILATKLHDSESRAKAFEGMANASWKLAEYSMSLEYFAEALEIYRNQNNAYGVARCFCGMGIICGSMDEYITALEYFEEGLAASKEADRPQLTASITGNIGHVYFNFGRYREAMDCFQLGLEYYRDLSHLPGAANMLSGIAGVHVFLAEYQLGLDNIEQAIAIHKKANHIIGYAVARMNRGIALHRMGRIREAEQELLSTLDYARSVELKSAEFDILEHLLEFYTDLEKPDKVAEYTELYAAGITESKKQTLKIKNERLKQRALLSSFRKKN